MSNRRPHWGRFWAPPPALTAAEVAHYIANHSSGGLRGRHGDARREEFDDLDQAKQACDRWQRAGCRQAIDEVSTGRRWVRLDSDPEWSLALT